MTGKITKIVAERAFGFIRGDDDSRGYFFHMRDVGEQAFALLFEGDRVSFEPSESPRGPRAAAIQRL